ncbi:three-Cys-motif partner protein [Kribbella aluminosa]|uniref:Three-Cys-motif partner protein n=1 Tax=Kribbella aluminosa TaxID=416017 RepID=A0ABS4USG1_9ACTN|nr:three-Cys-motif partner protein TcmP [Kribbella aluminosa]MBP2354578.1 three-Cys-motif partner protein [Kribbella aluminosa]
MARGRKAVELWDRPPHTAAKHQLLQEYLGAWFPILAKYNRRLFYYDAFAGPGRYKSGDDGSPLIALKTLIEHDYFTSMPRTEFVFLFNEQDPGCAEHLEGLIDELKATNKPWPANVRVGVTNNTFIELTTDLLDDLDSRAAKLAPTFAFVDPVGVKATPMAVLRRLTDFPKGELLVYFAHEAVFRFCGAGNIDQALTDLFGTEEYKDAGLLTGSQRSQYIHDLYKRQLHEVCNFPYIQSFAMYDHRGKRLYDLFYCTREPIGLDRMKGAMWKIAPSGDFSFRDRFANQDVIFGAEVDTTPLQSHLLTHFSGQAVTIEAIVDHVIVATPYASGHVKRATLAVMQRSGLISSPNQKRKGTFTDGTIVIFP